MGTTFASFSLLSLHTTFSLPFKFTTLLYYLCYIYNVLIPFNISDFYLYVRLTTWGWITQGACP